MVLLLTRTDSVFKVSSNGSYSKLTTMTEKLFLNGLNFLIMMTSSTVSSKDCGLWPFTVDHLKAHLEPKLRSETPLELTLTQLLQSYLSTNTERLCWTDLTTASNLSAAQRCTPGLTLSATSKVMAKTWLQSSTSTAHPTWPTVPATARPPNLSSLAKLNSWCIAKLVLENTKRSFSTR